MRLRRSVPYPIADLPPGMTTGAAPLLLFCGAEHGGWRRGVCDEAGWHDPDDATHRLEPSHFPLVSGRSRRDETKRLTMMLADGVVAMVAGVLAIGQVAYGDPWALCAPGVGVADLPVPPAGQAKGAGHGETGG